eukprot:jgi/Ulvmu1/5609/UM023_0146.1
MLHCKLGKLIEGESCRSARSNSQARTAMNCFGDVSLQLAIAQRRLKTLISEHMNTNATLDQLVREQRSLQVQLKQLQAEATSSNWFLQDTKALYTKIFSADTQVDEIKLQQTHRAIAQQRMKRHCVVSGALVAADKLDKELAQQIQTIKVVATEWNEMKLQVSNAAETLERYRVRRVQAEQDHTDHFRFGDVWNEACAATQLPSELPAGEREAPSASRIPRCTVLSRGTKHLDEVPLLLDKSGELKLLETLPPLKLLMMLQVWICAKLCIGLVLSHRTLSRF